MAIATLMHHLPSFVVDEAFEVLTVDRFELLFGIVGSIERRAPQIVQRRGARVTMERESVCLSRGGGGAC